MEFARNFLAKPAISAATGAVILPIATGASAFNYNGKQLPVWQLGAGLGAVSSVGTEFISKTILPQLSANEKLLRFESLALHLISSGLMFAIIPKILINPDTDMEAQKRLFVAGAASEIASNYIYNNFIHSEGVVL